jgi:hypothetical protein
VSFVRDSTIDREVSVAIDHYLTYLDLLGGKGLINYCREGWTLVLKPSFKNDGGFNFAIVADSVTAVASHEKDWPSDLPGFVGLSFTSDERSRFRTEMEACEQLRVASSVMRTIFWHAAGIREDAK